MALPTSELGAGKLSIRRGLEITNTLDMFSGTFSSKIPKDFLPLGTPLAPFFASSAPRLDFLFAPFWQFAPVFAVFG